MCVFNGTSLCAALLGSTLTFKSKPANALAAPRAPARPPLRTALWRRRTAGLRSLIGKHPNGRPCKHFYLWPFSFFRKQSFDSLAGGGLADAREPRAGGSVRGGRSECAITSSSCFQLSVPAPRPARSPSTPVNAVIYFLSTAFHSFMTVVPGSFSTSVPANTFSDLNIHVDMYTCGQTTSSSI